MNQKQKIYLILSVITVITGQILTAFYRPYIYNNKIFDFGFADTIGSLVSVIAFCLFMWGFKIYTDKEKNIQILITVFIYAIFWEFLGFFRLYGTFDWKDIVATIISGILTFFIKEIIEMKIKTEIIEISKKK